MTALCGIPVLNARNSAGDPTYLSFYYYRIRGSAGFHLRTPGFGDLLHVTSSAFGFGSESILTLHRLTRTPAGQEPEQMPTESAIEPDEFYSTPGPNCLYVENFNRWVARGTSGGNENLLRSSPVGFRVEELPKLPAEYSPRLVYQSARTRLTFRPDNTSEYAQLCEGLQLKYRVDPSRDLNGVGLLYFAAYFSIVDWAVLQLWRNLGRDDSGFLDRVVLDQQICYIGNADAGTVISVDVQAAVHRSSSSEEWVDVVLRDDDNDRLLAICTVKLAIPETGTAR